jgi:hypothetical protein
MGMCCKGKNKQGQYRPSLFLPLQHIPMVCIALVCFYLYNTFTWSVLPLFVFTFTTHSHGQAIQNIRMCCKGKNKQEQYRPWECVVKAKNKQGQYRPWECVVKVKINKGNTDHGNVL